MREKGGKALSWRKRGGAQVIQIQSHRRVMLGVGHAWGINSNSTFKRQKIKRAPAGGREGFSNLDSGLAQLVLLQLMGSNKAFQHNFIQRDAGKHHERAQVLG